jgi:repressor of nif and glnA expression
MTYKAFILSTVASEKTLIEICERLYKDAHVMMSTRQLKERLATLREMGLIRSSTTDVWQITEKGRKELRNM